MKRGQQRIGLLLLLIVAAIGITGLVITKKDTTAGAYSTYGPVQAKLPIPWEEVYGITYGIQEAEAWCAYKTIAEGGWLDPLKKADKKQFTCYKVPYDAIPPEYLTQIGREIDPYVTWGPVLCKLEGNYVRNPAYKYPLVCIPPVDKRFG